MKDEEFQRLVLEELSGIKGQISETNQIVKDLLHRTEELDAKLDGLAINTASNESIADLAAKFDVLNNRLFQQEADIQRLKKAQ